MPGSESTQAGWISQSAHYENFPVASLLVPARLRAPIAAVYRFARYADDIADEGEATASARLAELTRLASAVRGHEGHPIVDSLLPYIDQFRIDREHFLNLLSAFSQDARGPAFADRQSLLDYCRRSADPVGRIVLRVFNADRSEALDPADQICTALQLINFAQDIGQDIARGRCYVPADELDAMGLDQSSLQRCVRSRKIDEPVRDLLNRQLAYALAGLDLGLALLPLVPWRLRLELAAIIAGGRTIAARVQSEDPFAHRIKLGRADMPALIKTWLGITLAQR